MNENISIMGNLISFNIQKSLETPSTIFQCCHSGTFMSFANQNPQTFSIFANKLEWTFQMSDLRIFFHTICIE